MQRAPRGVTRRATDPARPAHDVPALAAKAGLAHIGCYSATESMRVLVPTTGRYDADSTPSTGTETQRDFHARVIAGAAGVERGDHAVF